MGMGPRPESPTELAPPPIAELTNSLKRGDRQLRIASSIAAPEGREGTMGGGTGLTAAATEAAASWGVGGDTETGIAAVTVRGGGGGGKISCCKRLLPRLPEDREWGLTGSESR